MQMVGSISSTWCTLASARGVASAHLAVTHHDAQASEAVGGSM